MIKRKVLITGATSGIGLATAHAFAKYGDEVVLCARRKEVLEEVKKTLEKEYGATVHTFALDVRDKESIKEKIDSLIGNLGSVDILVNNAGLAQGLDPYQLSEYDDIETMVDTNIKGAFFVARAVLPYMVKTNKGHIINLGSTAGLYAYAGGAVYCATKAAIKTLSDGIRIDTIETDIKVTTIQPGIVETPFSETRFKGDTDRATKVYAGVEALRPEDIADIILYVANQPRRVQISDVVIMANQQATGFMIARKEEK